MNKEFVLKKTFSIMFTKSMRKPFFEEIPPRAKAD